MPAGANQAVAAALLSAGTGRLAPRFVCRLGDDAYLPWLRAELSRAGVDTSASRVVPNMSTGQGIVWLDAEGAATSVVLGGANAQGWSLLRPPSPPSPAAQQAPTADGNAAEDAGAAEAAALLAQHAAEVVAGVGSGTAAEGDGGGGSSSGSGGGDGGGGDGGGDGGAAAVKASVLLLQREVPEHVNEAFAAAAAAAGVPVLLDAGGEDRPVSRRLLSLVDFLAPNEQELQRLTGGMPTGRDEEVAAAAGTLMAGGARNVLVTLEGRGSLLLLGQEEEEQEETSGGINATGAQGGTGRRRCRPVRAIRQPALPVPGGVVADATAAGDAFRAALAVALVEGRGHRQQQRGRGGQAPSADYEQALRFAAAAGAIAVSRMDYHLQADYAAAWSAGVAAYRRLADACAGLGVAVSLEPKPTDPSSRFSFLPNTASALTFVAAVDRPNLGLTLDAGHMLMAGECLSQSAAEAAAAGRLFGLHLNDGHGRLGAEDGLVFGSVHAAAAQELVYYLRYKLPAAPAGRYSPGLPHAFFDTFPLNEDPVAEAAANVAAFAAMWARAGRLRRAGMEACLGAHDALCSLRLMASVP
ncbi:hypothetical protein GPECTOR_54g178 [Gonium pectorale]|uniref:Xylose isomerase-like TIM barrel domain-containing protein n=1 Tax=Gonium pectorale TaxID=33097 RepID=A0A150G6H6_GONPE|nr:hypothetical protein GPECTOR_54g178 [Gonium pectorale]|eukprot:KXZ45438.1 hypothetical protein GPECTOR_54g178 [Gonium pectorale]